MLTKKDLIAINQEFHSGKISNESSIDFALAITKKSRNWLKTTAIITRSILIDHVFEDGNKRTTAAIIMTYCYMNSFFYKKEKINELVLKITKENITEIKTIERLIKHVLE